MKIIEALKELRLLEKKIARNQEYITRYSSMVSTQVPSFNTVEEQRLRVQSLIQENLDHGSRKIELKERINYTNLLTYVNIMGRRWSLQNLLDLQRGVILSMRDTYASLSDQAAQVNIRNAASVDGKPPQIMRLYDENIKLTEMDKWDTFRETISSRLEVINAMTDLLELPCIETEEENAAKWDALPSTIGSTYET